MNKQVLIIIFVDNSSNFCSDSEFEHRLSAGKSEYILLNILKLEL